MFLLAVRRYFSVTDLPECKDLMAKFIELKPHVWNEDVGEV